MFYRVFFLPIQKPERMVRIWVHTRPSGKARFRFGTFADEQAEQAEQVPLWTLISLVTTRDPRAKIITIAR